MFDPADWLREHAFPKGPAGEAARAGVEVELLALDWDTGAPVDATTRLLPLVRACVGPHGGTMQSGQGGARIVFADGTAFAIEPGGQLELASAPCRSPSTLLHDVEAILGPLTIAAADAGIRLVGAGIDPVNPIAAAPLQIASERYCRMDAYFESIGPAGRRMMRQTAAVQVNVDPAGSPETTWRVLNAAAPFLTALFANSRVYAGSDTGYASYRAQTWRDADPARTGAFEAAGDPAAEYARFGLAAPAMQARGDGEYRPFADLPYRDDPGAWRDHLSTLFPEVRPKGYFEIRSIDARPVDQLALPLLMCAGLALDGRAVLEAEALLGPPDPARLGQAGRTGLADPQLAGLCRDLVAAALDGCRRLGELRCRAEDIERAAAIAAEILAAATAPTGTAGATAGP